MRGGLRLLAVVAATTLALLAPGAVATADPRGSATKAEPGTATGTGFAFVLVTPNTAVAPRAAGMASAGDSITVTGGGWFDPAARAVHGGGTFTHARADGTVRCRGIWKATALIGWTDFGAARGHRHGGVVSLLVTHYCPTMGMVHTGIPMTVTSALRAPSGSPYVTGVTVAAFTVPTRGKVRITATHGRHDAT